MRVRQLVLLCVRSSTSYTEYCVLWIRICKDSCLIRSSHIRGRPTLNDVERFRNEPVHELYSLKASQMCKVHTNSYVITNEPYVSSNYVNTGKTVTADLTTNYNAETNTSLAEKSRIFVNRTSKVALTTANWIRILIKAT